MGGGETLKLYARGCGAEKAGGCWNSQFHRKEREQLEEEIIAKTTTGGKY